MTRTWSRVGPKGQAVIPKDIRDQLGIRPGDRVAFRLEKDRIVVEPEHAADPLHAFLHAFPKVPLPDDWDWDALADEQYR